MRLAALPFALAALLLGAGAFAQTPEAVPGKPATADGELKATFVAQAPTDIVASKLIGTAIRNGADETIGTVADVVFGEDKVIKSLVVSVGGFLGVNVKYVSVAIGAVRLSRQDEKTLKAVINTDKDQLRAAPEYVYLSDQAKK